MANRTIQVLSIKEYEKKVLSGLVLDNSGAWCDITKAIAEENELTAHLCRGEVLINGAWKHFDTLNLCNEENVGFVKDKSDNSTNHILNKLLENNVSNDDLETVNKLDRDNVEPDNDTIDVTETVVIDSNTKWFSTLKSCNNDNNIEGADSVEDAIDILQQPVLQPPSDTHASKQVSEGKMIANVEYSDSPLEVPAQETAISNETNSDIKNEHDNTHQLNLESDNSSDNVSAVNETPVNKDLLTEWDHARKHNWKFVTLIVAILLVSIAMLFIFNIF